MNQAKSGEQFFHLSLGPVQSFVSQARRTRDFWGGSFLLSWLSSVAMLSVEAQGGVISFPVPDKDFLAALRGKCDKPPEHGSVPNRFKALGARVDSTFDPDTVTVAVQQTWKALAEQLWQKDIEPCIPPERLVDTRALWDRQISSFWEINWCITPDETVSDLLDRRKNWRSHRLPDEPGVKCMMMEGFQEISAAKRPNSKEHGEFWARLRNTISAGKTDLRSGECLCAIAFVKRRFVRHFDTFSHSQNVAGQSIKLHGWRLKPQVPSVLYMAASPWYAAAVRASAKVPDTRKRLEQFLDNAERCVGFSETATPTAEVSNAVKLVGMQATVAGIDGVVFHASQLEAHKGGFDDLNAVAETHKALGALRQSAGLPEASAFYAVLMMDGDSLGSQMSDRSKQAPISHALQTFTSKALGIVRNHNGFLIYAGGDDVLALLPVDYAVRCAQDLRGCYEKCFEQQNTTLSSQSKIVTSLSAAIEFVHVKTPLTFVLDDAHALLDDIAKEKTGRDALAIRVWKPGGLHLQWAQPWTYLREEEKGAGFNLLSDLADTFALREQLSPYFTHQFLFKASELFNRLPQMHGTNESATSEANNSIVRKLLQAQLIHSGLTLENNQQLTQAQLDELLDPIMKLSTPHRRLLDDKKNSVQIRSSGEFLPDALKLIRFMVQNSIALHAGASN